MPPAGKVLFITRKWAPATGGMETYSLRLTQELLRAVPLEIMALPGRAGGMPPTALALLGFGLRAGWRLLISRGMRAVHLGDMALWPLALLRPRGGVLVLSAHGTDVAYHRRGGLKGGLYGAYLRLGARLLAQAKVIANSQATAAVLAETGWRAAAIIPLATDFAPVAVAGEPDGSILFAGRLVRRKGCGWFITHVLPLLPDEMVLKVAGTAWDAAESALLSHPRVQFLGALDQAELARAFARATCVIVPNIEPDNGEYEGFGLVAPEAASAGGVVVAALSGGLADAVIEGETGFLLPPGDAATWAAKITRIAGWDTAQRSTFVAASQAKSQAFYRWDRVARDTAALYS